MKKFTIYALTLVVLTVGYASVSEACFLGRIARVVRGCR